MSNFLSFLKKCLPCRCCEEKPLNKESEIVTNKSDISSHDNDDVVCVDEVVLIEDAKFSVSACRNNKENERQFQLTIEKPNCCCICFGKFIIEGGNLAEFWMDGFCTLHTTWDDFANGSSDGGVQQYLQQSICQSGLIGKKTVEFGQVLPDFRRFCQKCAEKMILRQLKSLDNFTVKKRQGRIRTEIFLKCPFCLPNVNGRRNRVGRVATNAIYGVKARDRLNKAHELLNRKLDFNLRFCPVSGCTHSEIGGDKSVCFTNCATHGQKCIKCWENYENEHKCLEIPKEFKCMEKKMKRCPHCQIWYRKKGGCNHMDCFCGKSFYFHEEKNAKGHLYVSDSSDYSNEETYDDSTFVPESESSSESFDSDE